jgi:transcriptional regulator with XRE-family HTH domain
MNERLRSRRNELNLTQAQLAEIVGVDRSMISKLESGGRCSISVGLRIAKALETTLEELFGTDEISATKETA